MPVPPESSGNRSPFAAYEKNYRMVKTDIYNRFWEIDYYILKVSKSARDFDYLMNQVKIKELHFFIIRGFLES